MQGTASDRPWFLWVHLYDPHAPYDPPADARARAGGDGYNGEIAFADSQLQRLIDAVERRPDAARTATILLGDHGESLGEHGEPTHGMLVFEPALRVPVVIKGPGIAASNRSDATSTVDIMPTVLALAGESAEGVAGRNLLGPPDPDRESYSESQYPTVAGWTPLTALTQDRWKLIVADRPMLYDLADRSERAVGPRVRREPRWCRPCPRVSRRFASRRNKAPRWRRRRPCPPKLRSDCDRSATSRPPLRQSPAAGGVNPATAMNAWAMFEEALAAINSGRTVEALPPLAKVAATYPASPIFQSTYARALASAGRKREALDRFRAAVKRWPADASLYHELAVVARDLGETNEARRAEEAALALDGNSSEARNGKGLLLADADRHQDAAAAFAEAVRLDPTNAVYLANLGNATRARRRSGCRRIRLSPRARAVAAAFRRGQRTGCNPGAAKEAGRSRAVARGGGERSVVCGGPIEPRYRTAGERRDRSRQGAVSEDPFGPGPSHPRTRCRAHAARAVGEE